jgi:uncharacterized membrane protein
LGVAIIAIMSQMNPIETREARMNIQFYLKLYFITIPIFFLIDMFWIGVVAKNFYRQNLAHILSPDVNWAAAIVFYLIYIIGILYFAVAPAIERDSLIKAIVWGGLFGFFTYATYDLTNMALIKGWPFKVAIVDILWGTVLCGSVAALSFKAAKWIG